MRGALRPALWTALVAAIVVLALVAPVERWAEALEVRLEGWGAWGAVAFVLVFACWNLVLPPLPLQLLAGFVYGVAGGIAVAYGGTTIAQVTAFLVARHGARERVQRFVAERRLWRALEKAVERGGWRAVVLARLGNFMPSSIANLLFGLTPLSLWTVTWASWLGKAPGIVILAAIGAAGGEVVGDGSPLGEWSWATLAAGVAASVLLAGLLTRSARQHLAEEAEELAGVVAEG